MKKKSEKLKAQVKTINYWRKGLAHALWKAEELNKDDASKKLRWEAESKTEDVRKIVNDFYGEKIGREIILEMT